MCSVKSKVCNLIIDNRSCENIASRVLVDHLKLDTEPRPHLCITGWIKKGHSLKVINLCHVLILIDKFYQKKFLFMWLIWTYAWFKDSTESETTNGVVSVSARSETSPSHESVDSTQMRPTRPRIRVDLVDSVLWWFCTSSQFNVKITTLACIYECSLCNLLYCACILIYFYRRRVYLYFRFMFSVLGDIFWTCDTWM